MWLQDCRESQGLNQVPYPTAGQAHPHALSVVHHAPVISPFLQLYQGFQGLTTAHPPIWLQDCRESQGLNQVPYPTAGKAHPHVLSVVHHATVISLFLQPEPGALSNVAGSQSRIPRRSATRTTLPSLRPKTDMRDLQYIIDEECSKLCSKNRTIFRTASTTEIARFNFDVYKRELKEIAPTLCTILEAAATSLNTDYERKSAPTSTVRGRKKLAYYART